MQALLANLSQDDKTIIYDWLDMNLNRMILETFLHGEVAYYL